MQLQRFVDALKADLSAVAELGNEETAEVAGRLVLTLQASIGLRLLDALSELALELNEKLPGGHVEVRLTGQDPELVFVSEEPEAPAAAADEAYTARITPAAARRAEERARDRSKPRGRLRQHLDRPRALAQLHGRPGGPIRQPADGLCPRLGGEEPWPFSRSRSVTSKSASTSGRSCRRVRP